MRVAEASLPACLRGRPVGRVVAAILDAALEAADPRRLVLDCAAIDPWLASCRGAVRVAGAGKAALAMGEGLHARLGDRITEGAIVVKAGTTTVQSLGAIEVLGAAHPVPDARSEQAARHLLEIAARSRAEDVLLCPISGGTSALLCAPEPPLTLEDMRRTTTLLLGAGVDILAFNTVRCHLDRIKGGGLARAAGRAAVVGLVLSDLPDGTFARVGSGPTIAAASSPQDALAILRDVGLTRFPASVIAFLEREATATPPMEPGPRATVGLADNDTAVRAAMAAAARHGWTPQRLPPLRGEARDVGRTLAHELLARTRSGAPICAVAGGETVVSLLGDGHGGRCQELALAAATVLDGAASGVLVAFSTDGEDGPTNAAGAVVTGSTVARARTLGLTAAEHLARNDAHPFFDALGDLVRTGPTGTNVCDLVLLLTEGG